ncbi:MAG: FAD-binding oxidoreductase [Nitrospiraceae bacterium]|nr:FAD-binding oxidoreductase [Nitrospiraceae bacterium]
MGQTTRATIETIDRFAEDVKLFRLVPEGEPVSFIQGQFIKILWEGEKGSYFAIASPPYEKNYIEILVKKGKGVSERLFEARTGQKISFEGPLGTGFPLDPHRTKNLLFVGVGTAIAPLRSTLLEALSRRGEFGRIEFYFGTLTPGHLYFGQEMAKWHAQGVNVVVTVTFPDEHWDRHSGFVQHILQRQSDPLHQTVAYVCGMKEMVEETISVLKERAIPEEHILQNI